LSAQPAVSVVIPALDEEQRVGAAVRSALDAGAQVEAVVADGGSADGTREAARAAGARVLNTPRGRGVQLHAGARAAQGRWLVFLHADTRLERGWDSVLQALPAHVVGGAFRFAVDAPGRGYRVVESAVALRCRLLRLPYGDQALFARREAYEASGGFPPLPLMEDVAFVRRLRRLGPLALPRPRAFTSPRRWERLGLVQTTLRNWLVLGLYAAGLPPSRLTRLYEGA
jgi:rSAM/selenodomain-associated transferase 2